MILLSLPENKRSDFHTIIKQPKISSLQNFEIAKGIIAVILILYAKCAFTLCLRLLVTTYAGLI